VFGDLCKRKPPPPIKQGEKMQTHRQRWTRKFNEVENFFFDFAAEWWLEVLPSLLRIFQAARLLLSPPSKQTLETGSINGQEEWVELMFSLYFHQSNIFKNRLLDCFKLVKKAVQESTLANDSEAKTLISELIAKPESIRQSLSDINDVRGHHVHVSSFTDKKIIDSKIARIHPKTQKMPEIPERIIQDMRDEYSRIITNDKLRFLTLLEQTSELFSRCFNFIARVQ